MIRNLTEACILQNFLDIFRFVFDEESRITESREPS